MDTAAKGSQQLSGRGAPNKIPRHLTSFIGRSRELSRLKALIKRSRMVTLTGPGGAGKSRLAAELSWASLDPWQDAVWWVGLGPVGDPRLVAGAVVSALELRGKGPAQDVVIEWLSGRRALLVLDNCEHLLSACADFCELALARCPQLTVVATSRQALGISGEAQWPVSSLPPSEAAQLFEVRAALVRPDFKVAARNLEVVTEICERIDHLPLAIELAAARIGMMTEQELLSQLTDRFQLLTGGSRTAPQRQQTLSATIDWSYRLLTEDEALLFRRLSVFRDGFDLESVEAVCGDGLGGRVLDVLAGLVQKSMVVAERTEVSATRYRPLESQLAYAADRLRETGESQLVRRRHYEYFLERLIAKTRNPDLANPPPGIGEARWVARESGNVWAAMGWAQNHAADLGLALAAYLPYVPFVDVPQLRLLLTDLLNRSPGKGVSRVHALRSVAALAIWQGDNEAALSAAEAALVLARELGDLEVLAYALTVAAVANVVHGDANRAVQMYEEANRHLVGSGNGPLLIQIKTNVAWLGVTSGDLTGARPTLAECVDAARAEGDLLSLSTSLFYLAWAQLGLDEHEAADSNFREALAISQTFTEIQEIIHGLQGLSCVAAATGGDQRALRLAAAANRLSGEWLVRSEPWAEAKAQESQMSSRSRLGTSTSDEAWNQGLAMTLEQVLDYALRGTERQNDLSASPLSQRERELATLVAAGLTNREIGQRLFISWRTVEGHLERIRNKLGVRSRTGVATWAVEHGLVSSKADAQPGSSQKRGTRNRPPSGQR